jgi:FKBP-type peptidyl-prolyl cis-trans isomerase 2
MVIQKNDFIELDFVARVKDTNEIFDTTNKEEAKKANLDIKELSPLILCVGKDMAIKGLDNSLEGKEINKEYSVDIKPEEAFGKRDPNSVKMIPLKAFIAQKIYPEKGMQLSLDGAVVKVLSNSGGRVLVDFNNPLAGKEVVYEFTIKRKVEDMKEKVNALQEFFFRKKFEFDLEDKKVIFKVPKHVGKFIEMLGKNIEEIIGLKVEVKEHEETKKEE